MAKAKYKYNPQTLSYDKIELSFKKRLFRTSIFLSASTVIGVFIYIIVLNFFDSPKEKLLRTQNAQLEAQYTLLNKKLDQVAIVLDDLQYRDDNIYRTIFEAEPIAKDIRKGGFGGINRYKKLEALTDSKLIVSTAKRIDELSKQLYIQSKSFDDVFRMAKEKEKMLAAIPAIQPLQKEQIRNIGGFGRARMHPVLKIVRPHNGMDFSATTGTPIYATGTGKVIRADRKSRGFGNHVRIDHGYGYVTLYAHMARMNVEVGQEVKRGDVIGFVGNTGISSGPHCHYEVRKNGTPLNPINYYYGDLTPEEYSRLRDLAEAPGQSMD